MDARDLAGADDRQLMDELRARGYVLSVWSHEDVASAISESGEELDDAEREELAKDVLPLMARGLEDILASRGNEHISNSLDMFMEEAKAARLTAPAN